MCAGLALAGAWCHQSHSLTPLLTWAGHRTHRERLMRQDKGRGRSLTDSWHRHNRANLGTLIDMNCKTVLYFPVTFPGHFSPSSKSYCGPHWFQDHFMLSFGTRSSPDLFQCFKMQLRGEQRAISAGAEELVPKFPVFYTLSQCTDLHHSSRCDNVCKLPQIPDLTPKCRNKTFPPEA